MVLQDPDMVRNFKKKTSPIMSYFCINFLGSTSSSTMSLGAADFVLAKPTGSTTSMNAMGSSNLNASELAAVIR